MRTERQTEEEGTSKHPTGQEDDTSEVGLTTVPRAMSDGWSTIPMD